MPRRGYIPKPRVGPRHEGQPWDSEPSSRATPTGLRPKGTAMPQSLSAVYVHAVFSTKGRRPFLREAAVRTEMHACLGGISKRLDCPPLIVGGIDDHVHLLVRFGRTITQADWIKEIKRVSSLWIKERAPDDCNDFAWQAGYGVFSVSRSRLDAVHGYIATQDRHHRKTSFEDELRGLLRKHEMAWDERYVWD